MTVRREQPSWLMLERYALGELSESERTLVRAALSDDPASAECLATIQADARSLPPLPKVERVEPALLRPRSSWTWFRWELGAAAAVTLAAIGLLVLPPLARLETGPSDGAGALNGAKGDALAISLVREREGSVAWDPTAFGLGDRFKVRVTCAVARSVFATVVVYQGGSASFPIDSQAITCGNEVVLRGAFTLGDLVPARVCAVLAKDAPVGHAAIEAGVSTVEAACVDLTPVR